MASEHRAQELSDLLARVEGATGRLSDDDVGRLVCAALGEKFGSAEIQCGDSGADELGIYNCFDRQVWSDYRQDAPDASVDAAIALVERTLPGWRWVVRRAYPEDDGRPLHVSYVEQVDGENFGAIAPTPALAILAALLRALLHDARDGSRTQKDADHG